MLKWCNKLHHLAVTARDYSVRGCCIYSSIALCKAVTNSSSKSLSKLPFNSPTMLHQPLDSGFWTSNFHGSIMQMREFSSKERKRKRVTPATSKLKKTKMKSYSSFKLRFRIMRDGKIRRWREGKRHNAHLKSKKAKRRLRRPGIVPAAYAKVMKKLNFCG